jgi:hypothetical protein
MKKVAMAVVLIAITGQAALAQTAQTKLTAEQAREENAYALGVRAYLWGAPFLYTGGTLVAGQKAGAAGINTYRKFDTLKTAKDRFVTTPNNVTIDAYGAADVTKEPAVVFVPKLSTPRWYLVQIGDYYDEVICNIGGTKGEQPGVYVLTGPDFAGEVPGEMTQIRSRTRFVVVAARIAVNGNADLPKAVDEQKGFHLMPLSAYLRDGLSYKPPATAPSEEFTTDAPDEIKPFGAIGHWMNRLLAVSADADDTQIASLREIGLSVAKGFEWKALDDATKRGLARAAKVAPQIADARWEATGEMTNGWRYTFAGGRAGFDLALRAALAKNVTGAQVADQVIYPNTKVDDKGEQFTGTRKYVLHFDAGKAPPVSVFWNLNMFGPDMFFVENDFGRYSIGSTTDGLKKNADGSLDILIQKDRPADTSNWLPAPAGEFNLTMRLYGPQTSVLDGSYRLPAVHRVQ